MAIVHVVVSVCQGCAEGVRVFTDNVKADEAETKAKKDLGIIAGHEEESENQVEVFYNIPVE